MFSTSKAVDMPLIFVPTPLGNLRDVTLRAIDVLRDCSLLVAEDTRVAKKLLHALGLPGKEVWSYHEHNRAGATAGIIARAQCEIVAVVTDAGLPGISVPCGLLEGLPVGLQIVTPAFTEDLLLRIAYTYEQSRHYERPNIVTSG